MTNPLTVEWMGGGAFLFNQGGPHWPLVFWSSFVVWCVMEIWLFSCDVRSASGEVKDGNSSQFLIILVPASFFMAFTGQYSFPQAQIALPQEVTFYTGIACIWIGIALRLWAVATLGRFFRVTVFLQTSHQLITSGPYRVLRHPSYTALLIMMTGLGLAIGNWVSVIAADGFMFFGLTVRILAEERALAEHFSADFAARKRHTWAIIPFIW